MCTYTYHGPKTRPASPATRAGGAEHSVVLPAAVIDSTGEQRPSYATFCVGVCGQTTVTNGIALSDGGGAQVSMISLPMLQRIYPHASLTWDNLNLPSTDEEAVPECLRGWGGGKLHVKRVKLVLQVGQHQPRRKVWMRVVEHGLNWDLVIGHDLFKIFQLGYDPSREILVSSLNGEEIPCPTTYTGPYLPATTDRAEEAGVYHVFVGGQQVLHGPGGAHLRLIVPDWKGGPDGPAEGVLLQAKGATSGAHLFIPPQLHTVKPTFFANALLPSDQVVMAEHGAFVGYLDCRPHTVIHNWRTDPDTPAAAFIGGTALDLAAAAKRGDLGKFEDAQGTFDYRHEGVSEDDLKKVDLSDVPDEFKARLLDILRQHAIVGTSSAPGQSKVPPMGHTFKDPAQQPIDTRQYPAPLHKQKEIDRLTHEMHRANVVSPSTSSWNSPVILVKKPDGTWRFCVDLRKVNAALQRDGYKPPMLDNILDAMRGSKIFTTLDLCAGFHQLLLDKRTREITAFTTISGKWEYNVATMGLTTSPAHMQRALDTILRGLQWDICVGFVDDTCIYSKTWEQHLKDIEVVLRRFKENGLHLRLDKCRFGRKSVHYLGHIISEEGVATAEDIVRDVKNAQPPRTLQELQHVLGLFGYYRRFIKGFAGDARPMSRYLKEAPDNPHHKNAARLVLDAAGIKSFQLLQQKICEAPVLRLFDPALAVIITSDGGEWFASHIVSQRFDDGEHPVSYWSREFSPQQHTYSSHAREMLSLVWAVLKWHEWINILGHFTARYDHAGLSWLRDNIHTNSMYNRWLMTLAEFTITYEPVLREQNRAADALGKPPFATPSHVTVPAMRDTGGHIGACMLDPADLDNNDYALDCVFDCVPLRAGLCDYTLAGAGWLDQWARTERSSGASSTEAAVLHIGTPHPSTNVKLERGRERAAGAEELDEEADAPASDPTAITSDRERLISYWLQAQKEDATCIEIQAFTLNGITPTRLQGDPKGLGRWCDDAAKHYSLSEDGYLQRQVDQSAPEEAFFCIVVPEKLRRDVCEAYHEGLGHLGVAKTLPVLQKHFWWKGMRGDLESHDRSCSACQFADEPRNMCCQGLLKPIITQHKFELMQIDVSGPYPITRRGNRYVVGAQDSTTRFTFLGATANQKAQDLAQFVVNDVFAVTGPSIRLLSDQGSNLQGNLSKELCWLFGVKLERTTAYHPECNGLKERGFWTTSSILRKYVNTRQNDWDLYIGFLQYILNTTYCEAIGMSPYEAVFGHTAHTALSASLAPPPLPCANAGAWLRRLYEQVPRSTSLCAAATSSPRRVMSSSTTNTTRRPSTWPGRRSCSRSRTGRGGKRAAATSSRRSSKGP